MAPGSRAALAPLPEPSPRAFPAPAVSGFGVSGLGFRVEGLGLRVEGGAWVMGGGTAPPPASSSSSRASSSCGAPYITRARHPLGPLGSSSSQHRRTPELVL